MISNRELRESSRLIESFFRREEKERERRHREMMRLRSRGFYVWSWISLGLIMLVLIGVPVIAQIETQKEIRRQEEKEERKEGEERREFEEARKEYREIIERWETEPEVVQAEAEAFLDWCWKEGKNPGSLEAFREWMSGDCQEYRERNSK
jgi:heme exporter protein D